MLFAWHLLCLISAIQLNKIYFQVVPLTAAVIVTTPQKLAFIDVAKGVRMFSKLKVWFVSSLQSPWNCFSTCIHTHTHIHGGRNYLYGDENTHEHDARELKNMYVTCYLYIFMLSILSVQVPCVAVVENMCHFDADGKRYYPFGRGSGSQACSLSKNLIFY